MSVPAWKPRVFDALLAWQHDRPPGDRSFTVRAMGLADITFGTVERRAGYAHATSQHQITFTESNCGDMTPEQIRARLDNPFAEVG